MILKIRNINVSAGINWKLIDNINELNYEYMKLDEAMSIANSEDTPSYIVTNFPSNDDNRDIRCCFIWVTKNDGSRLFVLTDDTAYILNDNGKTVDGVYL